MYILSLQVAKYDRTVLLSVDYCCSFDTGSREMISVVTEIFQGELESRVKCLQCSKVSVTREPFQDLSLPIPGTYITSRFFPLGLINVHALKCPGICFFSLHVFDLSYNI